MFSMLLASISYPSGSMHSRQPIGKSGFQRQTPPKGDTTAVMLVVRAPHPAHSERHQLWDLQTAKKARYRQI